MYCHCKPEGERVEMIPERYPDPERGGMVNKMLCCACGYTELVSYEDEFEGA